jgi:hypothetical protein
MHDSEPVWVASPSPYETFIHNTLPVFTGAPKSETNRSAEIRNPKHRKQKRVCSELFFDHLDLFRILGFEFFLASDSLGVLCAFARLSPISFNFSFCPLCG